MKHHNQVKSAEYRMRHVLFGSAVVMAFAAGPTLAQDDEQQSQDQQDGMDITVDQAKPDVTVDQKKPIVTVKQYPPEVTVKQPSPEITVKMPEPEVTIKQKKPDVSIKMPDPDINVEQKDPEIDVTRSKPNIDVEKAQESNVDVQKADADVQFEDTQEPKVTVEQSDPNVTVEKASKSDKSQSQQLMSMKGDDIVGKDLMGKDGESVGEITDLVVDKKSKKIFAVVDVGGVSSGQAKGIVVAMEKISLKQGELMGEKSASELKKSQGYTEGEYQPIQLDRPVSDFSSGG